MDDKVLIAIVSASSALAGVVVAQGVAVFQSWLERKHRRNVLLREKYEEMTTLFIDSMKWPSSLLYATSLEQIVDLSHPANANKTHMLCMLYFPLLRDVSGQYIDCCTRLYDAVVSSYNPQDKRPIGEQAFSTPQYKKARDSFFAAKDEFQKQIEALAHVYAGA